MKSQCHVISMGSASNSYLLYSTHSRGNVVNNVLWEGSLIFDTGISINIPVSIDEKERHSSGLTFLSIRQWSPCYRKIYMTDEGFFVFGIYRDSSDVIIA